MNFLPDGLLIDTIPAGISGRLLLPEFGTPASSRNDSLASGKIRSIEVNVKPTLASYPFVDNEVGGVDLQLPYDHLHTASVPFVHETHRSSWTRPAGTNRSSASANDPVNFVISAWIVLLFKYTGQSEIPFSTTLDDGVTKRCDLPMRAGVTGENTFRSLSLALRDGAASTTSVSSHPLEAAITVRKTNFGAVAASDGAGRDVALQVFFEISDSGAEVTLTYCSKRFESTTIGRIARHLIAVLNAASEAPNNKLSQIDLLSVDDRLWFEENCFGGEVALADQPVHQCVAARARQFPEKTAVIYNGQSQTYAELVEAARRFTAVLSSADVKHGGRIAVCLDPCLEYPSVLLAVLDYGCVYVPLNPAFPQSRIDAMLQEVRAEIVISTSSMKERVSFSDLATIEIDDPRILHSARTDAPVSHDVAMNDSASVYFTSGSTGRPKAVEGKHQNVLNMMTVSRRCYGFSEADIIPAVASFTFSISMFELMTPLTAGGTLLILDRDHVVNAEKMAETLSQVTVFHIGPSLLRGIVNYINNQVPDKTVYRSVRHVSSGGDMVPPELLTDLRDIFATAEVYDIYGCSEISIMGCSYRVLENPVSRTYVGKVFENSRLLVIDDDNNYSPLGAVGDVCLGGRGVVDGYIGRPELNEQLFFELDGVRYYRTGDRGRLNAQGDLELLGRRDFQVQIRGMRVELGEIDYHLRNCAGVSTGVVSSQLWQGGAERLVAYYVPDKTTSPTPEAIRMELAEHLPDYMVPPFYVELDELPLNQNMKIDRKALPPYQLEDQRTENSQNAPATESEVAIAKIWSDILNIDSIGVAENFMLLGGDSIQAVEMILTVEKLTGVKLDGMSVLRESLEVLARLVDSERGVEIPAVESRQGARKNVKPAESFYFGKNDSLYGLYNSATEEQSGLPVLICPALGNEGVRTYFILKMLASDLAARGIPVFRFDYFGSGDSMGENNEGCVDRWLDDIRSARDALLQRTGGQSIRVIGVRIGATLALEAFQKDEVESWLFLDPIATTEQHFVEQKRMHREREDKLLVIRNLRRPAPVSKCTELLGFSYDSNVVKELTSLNFSDSVKRSSQPMHCFQTEARSQEIEDSSTALISALCVMQIMTCEFGWYDSNKVTATITNKKLQHALANRAASK